MDPEAHPYTSSFGRRYYGCLGVDPPSQIGKRIAMCDLALSEDHLHGALRKSYRSLINWGRRNLFLDTGAKWLDTYREFHERIAGRITRSSESWEIMRDALAAGRGELRMAWLDGELVAGTMSIDGTEVSVYWSAVYDRSRFTRPIGHWPVYSAILAARDRGMKVYELGEVPTEGPDKEIAIGFFKSGFATNRPSFTRRYGASAGRDLPTSEGPTALASVCPIDVR